MYDVIATFFIASAGLFLARKIAKKIGLVDKPNFRKHHAGEIPLVGGISITLVLISLYLTNPEYITQYPLFIICILLLFIVGVTDDRFDLAVTPRVINQLLISFIMTSNGFFLDKIGNLFVDHPIFLGSFLGGIVTFIAVVSAINSFNMVDGIDGLLGTLSIVTFSGLSTLFYIHHIPSYSIWCLCIVISVIPFLILNSGLIWGKKFKVFMGDAGSTTLGFTAFWMLLCATQDNKSILNPVNALWFISIPLMDMTRLFILRLCKGVSPFKPDREHIHHILLKMELTTLKAVSTVLSLAVFFVLVGLSLDLSHASDSFSLMLFILFLILYIVFFNFISKKAEFNAVPGSSKDK